MDVYRGPWIVNRASSNEISGPCNVIIGPWSENGGPGIILWDRVM